MFSVFSRRSVFKTRTTNWTPSVETPPTDPETSGFLVTDDDEVLLTDDGYRIVWTNS